MRLEFTYSFSDLKEALQPANASVRRKPRRWRALGQALFAAFAMFWVMMFFAVGPGSNKPWPLAGKPIDLLSDVFPSLVPAALFSALLVFAGWQSWRRSRFPPRPPGARRRPAGSRIVISVIFVLIVFSTIAFFERYEFLLWTPTRTERYLVSGGPWAVIVLLFAVFAIANHRWAIRAQWVGKPGWRRHKVVEIDAMGYLAVDELTQFRYGWGYFIGARETENLLVLTAEDSQQHIVPKRAFADVVDLQRCKMLLQSVITHTSFWPAEPTGFEMIPTPALPLSTIPAKTPEQAMHGGGSEPPAPSSPT